MSLVEKPKDRTSTTGQKFWPLKKFNLHNHHGKTLEQQPVTNVSPPKSTQAIEMETTTANEIKSAGNVEKDAQKKSKNTRLSSLLSTNRRQEDNSQQTVNINDTNNVDKPKSENHASNAATITKKSGKSRTSTYKNQKNSNMTAKSAGSGTLTRSQMTGKASVTPSSPPLKQSFFKSKNATTKQEKASKRPHSPPSKRNDSPTHMQQPPKIMLESVQQQIQQEDEKKIKRVGKLKDKTENDPTDNTKKKDTDEAMVLDIHQEVAEDAVMTNKKENQKKKPIQEILHNGEEYGSQVHIEDVIRTSTSTCSSNSSDSDLITNKKQRQNSFPSPPVTPASLGLTEFTTAQNNDNSLSNEAKYTLNGHYEPVSPTVCSFDEQTMHKLTSNDKVQQSNSMYNNGNSIVHIQQPVQQPIQRIQRLRPAASFATLRQLATTNGNYQYVSQQQPLQQNQFQQIKRRPVSFIEPSSYSNYNYATQAPPNPPASDDYLSVNRPVYYRRASSEDNGYYHIRHQSDNATMQFTNPNPSPPSSVVGNNNGRRLARSNTVHNVIIKDGQGHRIVQCVELDGSPPLQPQQLRRKTSSFESSDSFHSHHYHDWSPPPEIIDDSSAVLFSRQQQLEEFPSQQQLLLVQQQNTNMAAMLAAAQQQQQQQQQNSQDNNTDTSNSDSSSNNGNHAKGNNTTRKMKRKDSTKSLSSLCSTSPPITSFDFKCEQLKSKLEIERATVRSLQKQKEAITKDLDFLNKNVDELTTENSEWRRKYESEKTSRERFQDDLSDSMEKLSEATEQIRNLEKQNKQVKAELEEKLKEMKELEKRNKQLITSPVPRGKPGTEGKSNERLLAAQLQHSQNQIRLLKSTMEQFLRMGLFNDDLNLSNLASPTTSIDAIVSELKCGRSKQRRSSAISSKSNSNTTNGDNPLQLVKSKSRKSLVPGEIPEKEKVAATETTNKQPTCVESKSTPTAELDIQLRELLREKEILQAEYSKAPSSGGNALVRRRREELESRLDSIDSQMCRIKLKLRNRNIL